MGARQYFKAEWGNIKHCFGACADLWFIAKDTGQPPGDETWTDGIY